MDNFISAYKRAYSSDIPYVLDRVLSEIGSKKTTRFAQKKTIDTHVPSIKNRYPWMVLMAATIIIMFFIVPMSVFLVRHQSEYAMAAPYVLDDSVGVSVLSVHVVDADVMAAGNFDTVIAKGLESGAYAVSSTYNSVIKTPVVFTQKQLADIMSSVILTVIVGVSISVIFFSILRIKKKGRN